MGVTELVLSYDHLKIKSGLFLTAYIVTMVTITCLPVIRLLFIPIIAVSTDKEWCNDPSNYTCWEVVQTVVSHLEIFTSASEL